MNRNRHKRADMRFIRDAFEKGKHPQMVANEYNRKFFDGKQVMTAQDVVKLSQSFAEFSQPKKPSLVRCNRVGIY